MDYEGNQVGNLERQKKRIYYQGGGHSQGDLQHTDWLLQQCLLRLFIPCRNLQPDQPGLLPDEGHGPEDQDRRVLQPNHATNHVKKVRIVIGHFLNTNQRGPTQ